MRCRRWGYHPSQVCPVSRAVGTVTPPRHVEAASGTLEEDFFPYTPPHWRTPRHSPQRLARRHQPASWPMKALRGGDGRMVASPGQGEVGQQGIEIGRDLFGTQGAHRGDGGFAHRAADCRVGGSGRSDPTAGRHVRQAALGAGGDRRGDALRVVGHRHVPVGADLDPRLREQPRGE